MLRFRGSGDIKVAVREYFETRDDLQGRVVVDVPAGRGQLTQFLAERGARVEAYDLFPHFFEGQGIECRQADLRGRLPIPDQHADLVLCQEAIEHLEDPLHLLRELNRILKPGGTLVLTTPNVSHLRAKLSAFLIEGELYNRLPANELDAVWFAEGDRLYLGHLFLIGIQRLRVIAQLAGFRLTRVLPVKVSVTSLLLGVAYPAIALVNLFAYWRSSRASSTDATTKRRIFREIVRLNLHPTILFGKSLFLEFKKEADWDQVNPVPRKDNRGIV